MTLYAVPPIAFTSDRLGQLLTIFSMKSDGTDVKPLVRTLHETSDAAWSPDGRWIAYTDWRQDGNDIFVVPSTGGAPVRLTYRNGSWPRWHPRGDSIVFTSKRRGRLELFQLRVPDDLAPRR
jgi:tricorn protease-like protein